MPREIQPDTGYAAFLLRWHGIWRGRTGVAGLRRTLRQLQGVSMPVSELESSILRARLADYSPIQLDELLAAGEFVWQGDQAFGRHDGYISIFVHGEFPRLGRISAFADGARERRIRELLLQEDGLKFTGLVERLGGFPDDILRSLWKLVWNGELSSDSLEALRARHSAAASRHHRRPRPRYATRERVLPGSSGCWTLLSGPSSGFAAQTDRDRARAGQLLDRCGIVCRRTTGELDELWPQLEHLAARGRAVRSRLLQADDEFSAPGVEEAWRAACNDAAQVVLAAVDPANPFGDLLPWPAMAGAYRPRRAPGARVLLGNGRLMGYLSRNGRDLYTPDKLTDPTPLVALLRRAAVAGPVYLETINGEAPYETRWHHTLVDAGFSPSRRGYLLRSAG